jgi:hypothetical protein
MTEVGTGCLSKIAHMRGILVLSVQGLGVEDVFKQSFNVVGGEGIELGQQRFAA